MYFSVIVIGLMAAAATIQGYPTGDPTGAPTGMCDIDGPFHGVPVQTGPMPYDIILEQSGINSGQTIKVSIKGKNGETFRGHLIVARSKADNSKLGTFTVLDENSHIIECGSGTNAITQSNANDKKEITVSWTAPQNFKGEIYFKVTVVKVFDTYWVGQKSSILTVS